MRGTKAMLNYEDTSIVVKCQGFEAKGVEFNLERTKSVFLFRSQRKTDTVSCPNCKGNVYEHGLFTYTLRDMPTLPKVEQHLHFEGHRYRCRRCGRTFNEEIPYRYPGTRITNRAAAWIKSLLRNKLTIRAVQDVTGVHWETIRNIQRDYMEEKLADRQRKLLRKGYRPKFLAVDEFAIHKGHRYATCVMDLETGEVLWVGPGRSMEDFEYFFKETDPEQLSDVQAVAMDMNASYNRLVEKHMPQATIVYDRYHMQAQYGKDVLGVVRLSEARKHKEAAKQLQIEDEQEDKSARLHRKQQIKSEKANYAKLKKLRWTLLRNGSQLSDEGQDYLNNILQDHAELAVCYAMKEEMIRLFELRDPQEAKRGWIEWFAAAKASGIEPLVKFAILKEKRLSGLTAHAAFPISTGKLEGFNNKIKVAKRVGYGYRNESYFFTLIRFLSLPAVKSDSYNFP